MKDVDVLSIEKQAANALFFSGPRQKEIIRFDP
jgi:hypothetical protein